MTSLHCDPEFEPLVGRYDLAQLEKSDNTIYGIWPDFTLAYVNRGWYRFAEDNDGLAAISSAWPLGSPILDAVPSILREFYREKYTVCLSKRCRWEHLYECSTDTVYREFHMTTYPLGAGEGLLVVNSLRLERGHSRESLFPREEIYRDENGTVTQCCSCRRVLRPGWTLTWDWIPSWVKSPPTGVKSALCEPCLSYYYSSGPGVFLGSADLSGQSRR